MNTCTLRSAREMLSRLSALRLSDNARSCIIAQFLDHAGASMAPGGVAILLQHALSEYIADQSPATARQMFPWSKIVCVIVVGDTAPPEVMVYF